MDISKYSPSLLSFLEEVVQSCQNGEITQGMETLRDELDLLRSKTDSGVWRSICTATQAHPLNEYALLDPYTRRAREKPRGYAGDAPMLDYIYGNGQYAENPKIESDIGIEINAFTTTQDPALAVLHRRDLLADEIVRSNQSFESGEILAIACGHLRELDSIKMLLNGSENKTSMIALDQDIDSVDVVKKISCSIPITPHVAGLKEYVNGKIVCSNLSLAYAAGIFDYLPKSIARDLALKMLGDLRPGGRLIISNFLVGTKGVGYMEAVMDWFLIYRTQSEMVELIDGSREEMISDLSYVTDPTGCIGYLCVTRE